jgi:hypothetical protein
MSIARFDVPENEIVYVPFATYDSAGASVTITNFATTDIKIYKNGDTTERNSVNGYTLLDTDGVDFDGVTGIHGFSIDLSNNSHSGFYSVGGEYWVVVGQITKDTQAVNLLTCWFRIVPAEDVAGYPKVDAHHIAGSAAVAQITVGADASLGTTTYAEPGQGSPSATTSLAAKINYLYKAWRNKITQTDTTYRLFNDAGSVVDQKATVGDDLTTFTKTEIESGP